MTRSVDAPAAMSVLAGSPVGCSASRATLAPTATATPAPLPASSATRRPSGSGGERSPSDEAVDLVVVAASGGAGVSERFAPLLAAAPGQEVRTHSKIGSRPTELVSMLDVFSDPAHDQDPAEQGWIDTDGMHLSDAGKDVLVKALGAAGFEATEPPR